MPPIRGWRPATSRRPRRRSRSPCGSIRIRRRPSCSIKGWWNPRKAGWRRRLDVRAGGAAQSAGSTAAAAAGGDLWRDGRPAEGAGGAGSVQQAARPPGRHSVGPGLLLRQQSRLVQLRATRTVDRAACGRRAALVRRSGVRAASLAGGGNRYVVRGEPAAWPKPGNRRGARHVGGGGRQRHHLRGLGRRQRSHAARRRRCLHRNADRLRQLRHHLSQSGWRARHRERVFLGQSEGRRVSVLDRRAENQRGAPDFGAW